ncbi:unnamed protein product [Schistosoma curassoni]|uniref:Transposase n=1 Tax=Schistosoma curassoni TaxID=6186 RepID=A0A183K825_9TREM|nr:unnamed protein product [Schistosoma curassoni]
MSVKRIPRATDSCGREQTDFHLKRKLGKDDGGGWDIHYGNHQTVSRSKRLPGIPKNTLRRQLETDIKRMNSNQKGLSMTELDGECW